MPTCKVYPSAQAFVTPTDNRTHCYWLHLSKQTWGAARTQCQSENGDLVTILSQSENDFVLGIGRFTNSPPELWIGATDSKGGSDRTGPGTYHWISNEAWGYSNWNQTPPAQPDGFCDPCSGGQTCTCDHRAVLAMDGTWFDFWQDNARGYICEATPPQ